MQLQSIEKPANLLYRFQFLTPKQFQVMVTVFRTRLTTSPSCFEQITLHAVFSGQQLQFLWTAGIQNLSVLWFLPPAWFHHLAEQLHPSRYFFFQKRDQSNLIIIGSFEGSFGTISHSHSYFTIRSSPSCFVYDINPWKHLPSKMDHNTSLEF